LVLDTSLTAVTGFIELDVFEFFVGDIVGGRRLGGFPGRRTVVRGVWRGDGMFLIE